MDSMMTGLASDQGFASVLEHDLRPVWSIFFHLYQFSQLPDWVNHAVFIFDLAEFTGTYYESSDHLPSLIAGLDWNVIDPHSLFISHARNAPKARYPRFFDVVSLQT